MHTEKDCKNVSKDGTLLLRKQAERAWAVQLGGEKVPRPKSGLLVFKREAV